MDAETIERSIRKRLETAIAEVELDFPLTVTLALVRAVDGPENAWIGHVVFAPEPVQ